MVEVVVIIVVVVVVAAGVVARGCMLGYAYHDPEP